MKPLDFALIFLVIMIPLFVLNFALDSYDGRVRNSSENYHEAFIESVSDAAAYMSRMEEQQSEFGVRYSEEKQLQFDRDLLNVFYSNLALKFGIEGDQIATHNMQMHIPAIVLIRYDGYNIVTLDDKVSVGGNLGLEPRIWPSRPYTYELENGNYVYFSLDDNMTVYDRGSNRFYRGTFRELRGSLDLSPINNQSDLETIRGEEIVKLIEKDLAGAVGNHLDLVSTLGLDISFDLPSAMNNSIDGIGFMAFMQGYPLPGGESLDAYSFSDASVSQRVAFTGTIRHDGMHIAYEDGCLPSSGVVELETLRDAKQAALRGYFLEYCN